MPYSIENGRIFGILIDNSYTVGSVPVCNLKKLGLLIIAPAMCLEVLEIRNTTGTVPVCTHFNSTFFIEPSLMRMIVIPHGVCALFLPSIVKQDVTSVAELTMVPSMSEGSEPVKAFIFLNSFHGDLFLYFSIEPAGT